MSDYKPSRLKILDLSTQVRSKLGEVTTGQIFSHGNTFDPKGLYSVEIFGAVGSEIRTEQFGIINLKTDVLTPVIYKNILELGSFYKRIMEGKEFVVFDDKLKDFVPSTSREAKTGLTLFIKYLPNIKFKRTQSEKRDFIIELIYKSIRENTYLVDYWVVLPAGLRDYRIGRDGRPEEDEINDFYKKLINITNLIDPTRVKKHPEVFNDSIYGIQKTLYALYDYIMSLVGGKNKLIGGKWLDRRVFNSSSNVASSYINNTNGIGDPRSFGWNDARVGLHQYARSAAPLTYTNIRDKYIRDIFPQHGNFVTLTNSKTLKREDVATRSIQKDIDLWTSVDGIEKIVASLGNFDTLDDPITFNPRSTKDTYYMGLLYRDDKYFKFFQDIDDLPEGFSKDKVKPVTLYQFIYMSIYHMSGKYPGFVSRYPIAGLGSIFPAWIVIGTTNKTEILTELNFDWEISDDESKVAINFPVEGSGYFRTFTVPPSRLGPLGGDKM